ncbi:TPA: hypothetical protein KV183_003662, partial [Morganella morganii]|nr:hypothetical protein [Morganella morganii]
MNKFIVNKNNLKIFIFYFIINIAFYLYWGFSGQLGGDFKNIIINDENNYWITGAIELVLMLCFFIALVIFFTKLKYKEINISAIESKNKSVGIIILFLQVLFLIYSVYTGVGMLS